MACFSCDLNFNRNHELSGIGNINADIAILSDYPRAYESKKGVPFSNGAYVAMFNELANIGITTDNAYFTYLLKCPVDKLNAEYHKDYEIETKRCARLNLELKAMPNLKLVITLGAFTAAFVLNDYTYITSLNKVGNTSMQIGKLAFYFMYSPFYLMKNNSTFNDYKKLLEFYSSNINHYHVIF